MRVDLTSWATLPAESSSSTTALKEISNVSKKSQAIKKSKRQESSDSEAEDLPVKKAKKCLSISKPTAKHARDAKEQDDSPSASDQEQLPAKKHKSDTQSDGSDDEENSRSIKMSHAVASVGGKSALALSKVSKTSQDKKPVAMKVLGPAPIVPKLKSSKTASKPGKSSHASNDQDADSDSDARQEAKPVKKTLGTKPKLAAKADKPKRKAKKDPNAPKKPMTSCKFLSIQQWHLLSPTGVEVPSSSVCRHDLFAVHPRCRESI